MNKKHPLLIITFCVVFGVAIFVLVCIWLGAINENTIDIGTFLSAALAVLALIVSILTFMSIDSVDAISRMDGNVLENEGYRTDLSQLMHDLGSHPSEKGIVEIMEEPYKKRLSSGAQLADNLQRTIDYLILIPFILPGRNDEGESIEQADKDDEKNRKDAFAKKLSKLLEHIGHQVSKFERINAGSNILIDETFKLIKAVLYQQVKRYLPQEDDSLRVLMPSVRGTMLKNPVSKVVYYNYLGLFYMHKAQDMMEVDCGASMETLRGQSLCAPGNLKNPDRVLDYLDLAERQFAEALEVIGDDIMWNAFISYNVARTTFFKMRLSGKTVADGSLFDEAIRWRHRLNVYIADFWEETGDNNKQLLLIKQAFIALELQARLHRISCNLAAGHHDITENNPDLMAAKREIGNGNDFGRLRWRYEDIMTYLS